MQFHLNGFRTGDPDLRPVSEAAAARTAPPAEVDVLIVGCGPAGLTLAAQLSAFPGIVTRIVERKDGPLELGQADGVACRTMEMFEAFGFCERVEREAYWVNETVFWRPDAKDPSRIVRKDRIDDVEEGLSERPHVILNQARVHEFYLDVMAKAPTRLVPDYGLRVAGLTRDDAAPYPIEAVLEPVGGGPAETVRARYVVGCDGARSAVRAALGHELKGDSANQAWGVMDVLAVTDFPDIRLKALIQSAGDGSIVVIPREGGYLVRIYVELDKLSADERASSRNLGVDDVIAAARRILNPYSFEVKEVAWWSIYEIGQRVCDDFDDRAEGREPRVFIAGDACHTHSPKAGQGMNVSMQDAFNLGWKLAAVLEGRSAPSLLETYSDERRAIAKELIDFDRSFAALFSERPKTEADAAALQEAFIRHGRFTAGVATRYAPSAITGAGRAQELATGFPVGMRFHSAPVIRLADAKPLHLGRAARADGRWRLYAFASDADPSHPSAAIARLGVWLGEDPASPVRRFTPEGSDIDAVIDARAILQQGHRTLDFGSMPGFFRPAKGALGLTDYEKMFSADVRRGPDIFDIRGIDRAKGAVVIVRPDQYVAEIAAPDDFDAIAGFFDGVLKSPV